MATVNDLPEEILEYILCLISPYNDLRSCRQVCQRWYVCCQSVVEKRKSRFLSALKMGCIEWFIPSYPSSSISISQRYSHSACVFESSMYVFGGCTSTNTTFNDLWRFDLGSHDWTRLLTTGIYPSPKAYASMVMWNNCLVLFGGWTHPSLYPLHQQWVLFSELHVYDIYGNRWTQLYYPGSPPPTAGHSATVHGNVMVVFGGLQKQEGTSTSTNDIFCLDLMRQCWFKPVMSEPMPKPRYGHSQIKLDNRHILVLAGCGGCNKLYNDIWILTIPDNIYDRTAKWQWEQVVVKESEHMPSQMWYSPACKVGGSVVVLSTCGGSNKGPAGGNMAQLLVPGSVRRQAANEWIPPVWQPEEVRHHDHAPPERQPVDPNINGQRGFLRPGLQPQDKAESSSDESDDMNNLGAHGGQGMSVRGRPRPSIRPNASCDRERRLQVLSRMTERLRELSRQQDAIGVAVSKPPPQRSTVIPHMLDISKVISQREARWWPISQAGGMQSCVGSPPLPSLLYSLVLGRGHLVMFGGIPHDLTGRQNQENVSNSVTFVSAPCNSYFAA